MGLGNGGLLLSRLRVLPLLLGVGGCAVAYFFGGLDEIPGSGAGLLDLFLRVCLYLSDARVRPRSVTRYSPRRSTALEACLAARAERAGAGGAAGWLSWQAAPPSCNHAQLRQTSTPVNTHQTNTPTCQLPSSVSCSAAARQRFPPALSLTAAAALRSSSEGSRIGHYGTE